MSTIDNGVNVQVLLDAREALKGAPDAAQFTWRATSKKASSFCPIYYAATGASRPLRWICARTTSR